MPTWTWSRRSRGCVRPGFPYGAHTSCSDALWAGLPVLTQVGRSFSARAAASLPNPIGLPELAVADKADYERLSVLVANDAQATHDIRARLTNPLALPLFDNTRFIAESGALFKRMVGRAQQVLPPAPLAASTAHNPNPTV